MPSAQTLFDSGWRALSDFGSLSRFLGAIADLMCLK
jgi:hypothetical protein